MPCLRTSKPTGSNGTAAILHYYLVTLTFICVHSQLEALNDLDILDLEADSKEQILENFAIEICGVAFTTKVPSVLVNAFGPIAFCKFSFSIVSLPTDSYVLGARFLRSETMQQEVIRQLLTCKSSIGWPVERLIKDLKAYWETP
jgi:hypothetical protein